MTKAIEVDSTGTAHPGLRLGNRKNQYILETVFYFVYHNTKVRDISHMGRTPGRFISVSTVLIWHNQVTNTIRHAEDFYRRVLRVPLK